MEKVIPGTNKKFVSEDAFKSFKELIELTDGISLGQICSITGLDPFMIQNWVKRGYVARPVNKKYYEKHLARILNINALKEAMKIEDIGRLMELINGDVEDESDDLLSEEKLYSLFSKAVYNLDDTKDVKKAISKIKKDIDSNKEKIMVVLEVMVNAYLSGEYKKASQKYMNRLEGMK